MKRHTLFVAIVTALFAFAVLGCSSDGDDAAPAASSEGEAGQAPAASAAVQQDFELSIVFTSPVFNETRRIPKKHTCTKISENDPNISPPIAWDSVPDDVISFALVMDSLEGADDAEIVHWVIWNLPADLRELTEGIEHAEMLENGAVQGANDFGGIGYMGPCPPVILIGQEGDISAGKVKQQEIEKYTFRLYALDMKLDLPAGATKAELLTAMEGHVLAGGELVGERQGPTAFPKTQF